MNWLESRMSSARARLGALRWPSPVARRRIAWTAGSIGVVLVALVLFLGFADWNMFKRPVEGLLSARTGRAVHIDGNLKVRLLSFTPGATVEGLRVANPAWAGGGDTFNIPRLAVSVKLLPLFKGTVDLPLLQVDRPVIALARRADGANTWTFGKRSNKPFALPPIRRFEISQGQVTLNDAIRHLVFTGAVNSSEVIEGSSSKAFRLRGDGTLNTAPFDLDLTGGPLLHVDPKKPYPFDLKVKAGDTAAHAQGALAKPFDLGVFDASLAMSGQDLSHLYELTGLTLPNTPPYSLTGRMSRRGALMALNGMTGTVGSSDLAGDLSVRTGGARPMLTADLHAHKLDLGDLAAVLGGGAVQTAGAKASPEQAQRARSLAARNEIFPDTPLHVERLRTMDAHVKFVADTVKSTSVPMSAGSVDLVLTNGLLTLNPLTFDLPNGRISGLLTVDARSDVPLVQTDLRLSGARIDEFVPAAYKGAASGALLGRMRLSSRGVSVRQAAAGASGQVSIVVPDGEMQASIAELLGVNVLEVLFDKKTERTPLHCAVADFKVSNGIMTAQTIVIDTGPVIATGGGTVNLKTERLDLRLQGHPKRVQLIRLKLPLELTGPLRSPHLGIQAGSAAGQAGVAAVVGAVLSPLAVILPFVDAGLAKDANCQALVAQAGTGHPAPVQEAAGKPAATDR